jgi:hypothetical protein
MYFHSPLRRRKGAARSHPATKDLGKTEILNATDLKKVKITRGQMRLKERAKAQQSPCRIRRRAHKYRGLNKSPLNFLAANLATSRGRPFENLFFPFLGTRAFLGRRT